MPIHQNLSLLQRSADFEEIAIRCRQSAILLAWQHASPATRQAAPALPSCPVTAAARAALGFQVLNCLTDCQDKQWGTWEEVRQLHGCRLHLSASHHGSLPQHCGLCTPCHSGCQISNPTGEEFKATSKSKRN